MKVIKYNGLLFFFKPLLGHIVYLKFEGHQTWQDGITLNLTFEIVRP